MPAVRTFDDPPARRLTDDRSSQWRFTSPADMGSDPSCPDLLLRVGVVVALIETQVFGTARAAWRAQRDRIEGRAGLPLVVYVGASDCYRDGDPRRIGQDVAFCAKFCAIGRIWTCEVPPFGALTVALSIEHQLRSTPTVRSYRLTMAKKSASNTPAFTHS